jgi:hypothetical protein
LGENLGTDVLELAGRGLSGNINAMMTTARRGPSVKTVTEPDRDR